MSALALLARVIRTTDREDCADVHAYALHHAADLADELDMPLADYLDVLDEQILAALPARLTLTMSNARKGRKDARVAAMQTAADACATTWGYDGAIDLSALLPAIVAGGPAWLVIDARDRLAIPLEPLRRLHAAHRHVPARTARIMPTMLQIRWTRGWIDVPSPHGTAVQRRAVGGLNIPIRSVGAQQLRTEGAIGLDRLARNLDAAAE